MGYITYVFRKDLAKEYKGFYYQRYSNDMYRIYQEDGTYRGTKFTIKGCKELIDQIILDN